VKIKRMLSSVAAVSLLLGGLGIAVDALGASATTAVVPAITLSPDIGLMNGQAIHISGSGFAPGASLVAVECNGQATGVAGCDTSSIAPFTVSSTGTITSTFSVMVGTIGNGTCGESVTTSLCFIAIGTTSGALVADASIAFDSGPGVAVTPSTGLSNTQSVTLTGSDFTPGDTVYAVECLSTATTEAGCDTSTAVPMTVSPTGALPSTYFKVVTGKVGTGSCGTTVANYADCIIEVANTSGADRGVSTIDFVGPAVTTSPKATRVSGTAVIGKSVAVVVIGKDFTAVSKVTGGAGSTVRVTGVTSTALHMKITESARAKVGSSTLIIVFKSGKSVRVRYTVGKPI
jgi:Neocarzinostatin family